jgi:gliding motility-associated-like protein
LAINEKGRYWVYVSNPCGEASDTVVIETRNCEPAIWAPNAFTPNGDGLNDSFRVQGQNIDEYYLAIYDRWGEKVFETKDIHHAWDGRCQNRLCSTGVYIWMIRYSSLSSEYPVNEILKGTVLLYK